MNKLDVAFKNMSNEQNDQNTGQQPDGGIPFSVSHGVRSLEY